MTNHVYLKPVHIDLSKEIMSLIHFLSLNILYKWYFSCNIKFMTTESTHLHVYWDLKKTVLCEICISE
jgi:hypothetical protein